MKLVLFLNFKHKHHEQSDGRKSSIQTVNAGWEQQLQEAIAAIKISLTATSSLATPGFSIEVYQLAVTSLSGELEDELSI